MAATKKKSKAKRKPVKVKKKATVARPVGADVGGFLDLAEKLDLACMSFAGSLTGMPDPDATAEDDDHGSMGVLTQSIMSVALILDRVKKAAEAAYDNFKAEALLHYSTKGEFEHGKIAITFPEKTSRSPKWKQEAIDRAREIALSEGAEFDEKVFVGEVQETYPATVSTSVKLVVSA